MDANTADVKCPKLVPLDRCKSKEDFPPQLPPSQPGDVRPPPLLPPNEVEDYDDDEYDHGNPVQVEDPRPRPDYGKGEDRDGKQPPPGSLDNTIRCTVTML